MTPNSAPQRLSAWLEQAWLTRYLDRQLDSAETEWFEAYVLDKPELLTMIDADTRFRDALAADASAGSRGAPSASVASGMGNARGSSIGSNISEAATESIADSTVATQSNTSSFPRKPKSSFSFSHSGSPRTKWLALAATLVLSLGVGGLAMRAIAPPRGAELVASPTRIIYDTMRGEATAPRVEHADSTSSLVLIEVAVPPGAQNITLHVSGKPEQPLAPSPDGFVSFLLPRELVQQRKLPTVSYSLADGSGTQSIDLEVPLKKHPVN